MRLTVRVHARERAERLEWDGSTPQLRVSRILALDLDQLVACGSLPRLSDRLSADDLARSDLDPACDPADSVPTLSAAVPLEVAHRLPRSECPGRPSGKIRQPRRTADPARSLWLTVTTVSDGAAATGRGGWGRGLP
jgi:hypothetical protein